MTRRISSSRPMTGSSLPWRASVGEIAGVLLQRLELGLGLGVGDALRAADRGQGLEDGFLLDAALFPKGGRRPKTCP